MVHPKKHCGSAGPGHHDAHLQPYHQLRHMKESTLHNALIWIGAVIGVALVALLAIAGCYPDSA
ncbi:hypothetical protein [Paraburkholderia phytofirmans]|uniref:Uncharacterized protein n=1 Tax=Paraburkholderia phytofirmans TaxID=261302 RepID=A0ABW9BCI0_9BURK